MNEPTTETEPTPVREDHIATFSFEQIQKWLGYPVNDSDEDYDDLDEN